MFHNVGQTSSTQQNTADGQPQQNAPGHSTPPASLLNIAGVQSFHIPPRPVTRVPAPLQQSTFHSIPVNLPFLKPLREMPVPLRPGIPDMTANFMRRYKSFSREDTEAEMLRWTEYLSDPWLDLYLIVMAFPGALVWERVAALALFLRKGYAIKTLSFLKSILCREYNTWEARKCKGFFAVLMINIEDEILFVINRLKFFRDILPGGQVPTPLEVYQTWVERADDGIHKRKYGRLATIIFDSRWCAQADAHLLPPDDRYLR